MCLIIKVIFFRKEAVNKNMDSESDCTTKKPSISPIFNWKESAAVNKYKPVVATAIPSMMKMVAFVLKDK